MLPKGQAKSREIGFPYFAAAGQLAFDFAGRLSIADTSLNVFSSGAPEKSVQLPVSGAAAIAVSPAFAPPPQTADAARRSRNMRGRPH